MKNLLFLILIFCFSLSVFAQNPVLLNLKYEQNYSPTYYETIEMFQLLDKH